jgi:hypothetical protein
LNLNSGGPAWLRKVLAQTCRKPNIFQSFTEIGQAV